MELDSASATRGCQASTVHLLRQRVSDVVGDVFSTDHFELDVTGKDESPLSHAPSFPEAHISPRFLTTRKAIRGG